MGLDMINYSSALTWTEYVLALLSEGLSVQLFLTSVDSVMELVDSADLGPNSRIPLPGASLGEGNFEAGTCVGSLYSTGSMRRCTTAVVHPWLCRTLSLPRMRSARRCRLVPYYFRHLLDYRTCSFDRLFVCRRMRAGAVAVPNYTIHRASSQRHCF